MWRLVVAVMLLGGARGCEPVNGTRALGTSLYHPLGSPGGRYILQWCNETAERLMEQPHVMWESSIYVDALPPAECVSPPLYKRRSSHVHSQKKVLVADARCSTTCTSTILDLIYSGCYTIHNYLYKDTGNRRSLLQDVKYVPVDNGYSFNNFSSSITTISATSFQNDVDIKIHFGSIPLLKYSLELIKDNGLESGSSLPVSECTLSSPVLLVCRQRDLPPGRYKLVLQHLAPWTDGEVFDIDRLVNIMHRFEHTTTSLSPERSPPASSLALYVWWSVAGVLLLAALCGAGWLLWRRRARDGRLKKNVQDGWPQRLTVEKEAENRRGQEEGEAEDRYGPILLLYARDAEPFMDAMVLLRRLLAEHTGCKVYDLAEASTMCELAAAPDEWLRSAVSDARVRLVLVETPAAQHLYCEAPGPDRPHEPLLPARALYRRPDCCDTLLQYALRLARVHVLQPHTHTHYHKYFVATLSMFPAEVVPTIAPYVRYELPRHADLLARDLAPDRPAAVSAELLQRLSSTLDRFVLHARDNPHYLQDELMFL